MPERTAEELRAEIAAERQALAGEMDALRGEVRSLKPVAITGAAVVGLLVVGQFVKIGFKLFRR